MLRSTLSLCSVQVLGTPTREQIREMNPNYTEFKFPQIKAHPWTKVSQQVQEPFYFSKIHAWITACLCACDANMPLHTAIQPHHIHPTELHEALTAPHQLWAFRMTQTNCTQTFFGIWVLHICHKTLLLRSLIFFFLLHAWGILSLSSNNMSVNPCTMAALYSSQTCFCLEP